jgi:hypothetical protein
MIPLVVKILLIAAASFLLSVSSAAQTNRQSEFHNFLSQLDAAQLELQNGRAEPFKSLWSRSDDVTLSGGFGGTIEKGWKAIGLRLDWVGKQFSNGTNKIERLVAFADGNLGYVVQLEHISFSVPGSATESTKDYRVTMVFTRDKKLGWRIVHRQADSQFTKQAPK